MEEEHPLSRQTSMTGFMANFKKDSKEKKLGEGTYGVVTKVYDLKRQKYVALKKIKLDVQDDEGIPSTTIREIAILLQLKHPNIIELYEVKYILEEKKLYLVFEIMENDLKKFLDLRHPLEPIIIQSLAYCHSHRILHRDLKPQNILMNSNNQAKLADFGLSRVFPFPMPKFTKEIATLWYRAPELMLGDDQYGPTVDIWSVGCIMGECFTNKPLFMGDSQIDMLFKIMQTLGTPTDKNYVGLSKLPEFKLAFPKFKGTEICNLIPEISKDQLAQDILSKMLQLNPGLRPEAKELIQHPYFDEIRNMKI